MTNSKIIGFFDFHITADKTMDFLHANGFHSQAMMITPVKSGEKFGEVVNASKKTKKKAVSNELDHHHIIDFFKHLLHFEGKPISSALPYVADRSGYIITIIPSNPEQKIIAIESLHSHGAYFVKEM